MAKDAGVAGGNGQSGTGVRLMTCQIIVNETTHTQVVEAENVLLQLMYAADNGAVICQNSWGYPTLA
jgi:hypothetical protein